MATPGQAHRSLLKRSFGAFSALVILVWLALMVREVIDVKVTHARNGQAWNHVWAEHVRLQALQWMDAPHKLHAALAELERLRTQEWIEMGFEPPVIAQQVWIAGHMVHRQAPQGLAPERIQPNEAHFASDAHWLYVEVRSPDQEVVVRRWQERPGNWHFSIHGLAYYARPLFFTLPLMLLPAWLLMRQGFAPLRRIGRRIARRSAGDLSPLPPSPYVELAPIVQSVNSLMQRLQQRLSREQEFLLDAAHELKTPLAVIQLNAEALRHAAPDHQQAAQLLQEGVERATHTVHQLLALARSGADSQSTQLLPQDLVTLAQDRIALASQLAVQKHMDLVLDAPAHCWLPLHLESMGAILDNLLDNAIKYAPPHSEIRISIEPLDTVVRLQVQDQGPGIPHDMREKVFERFFRLPDMPSPGSGLGLSIVERSAQRHQAQVSLHDAPGGQGLCVRVDIPSPAIPALGP